MDSRRLFGAVVTTLLAPGSALAQGRTWEWDWTMHPMMFMWGAGGIVMMAMMLLFWASSSPAWSSDYAGSWGKDVPRA